MLHIQNYKQNKTPYMQTATQFLTTSVSGVEASMVAFQAIDRVQLPADTVTHASSSKLQTE